MPSFKISPYYFITSADVLVKTKVDPDSLSSKVDYKYLITPGNFTKTVDYFSGNETFRFPLKVINASGLEDCIRIGNFSLLIEEYVLVYSVLDNLKDEYLNFSIIDSNGEAIGLAQVMNYTNQSGSRYFSIDDLFGFLTQLKNYNDLKSYKEIIIKKRFLTNLVRVSAFSDLSIYMYKLNSDLNNLKIVVEFEGKNSFFLIANCSYLEGSIPEEKRKIVEAWLVLRKNDLLANVSKIQKGESPLAINGLK